jgi:hypothetical protein
MPQRDDLTRVFFAAVFFQSVANEYMLRLSDGWGLRSSVLDSAFVDAAAGSFVDGKRTGLSGYIFGEMAGKVSTLALQASRSVPIHRD